MDAHIYPNEKLFHQPAAEGQRWQPSRIIEELKPKAVDPDKAREALRKLYGDPSPPPPSAPVPP